MENQNFYVMYNVGKCKYVLNYHRFGNYHKDGSLFYDCELFSNKKKLVARITELKKEGFEERF